MKTNWIICLLAGMWLAGCSPNDPAPNEDVATLHEKFHGKYKPISSIASEPIDVNLDGKSSDDLFREYNYLAQSDLRIDVMGPGKYRPTNFFGFYQMWPEQYVRTPAGTEWKGELVNYDRNYSAGFAEQGSTRTFTFSPDVKQIYVQPNENEHPYRWVRPESVIVEANGRLRVVNKRRLYTSAGVKEVVITTVYQRYTMST